MPLPLSLFAWLAAALPHTDVRARGDDVPCTPAERVAAAPRSGPRPAAHPLDGPDVDLRVTITPDRVALDVGLNFAFVDEVMPMVDASGEALAPADALAARDRLFAWLRLRTRLAADGEPLAPRLAGCTVDEGDPALLPLFPRTGRRGLAQLRFRIDHELPRPPRTVDLVWQVFAPVVDPTTRETTRWLEVRAVVVAAGSQQTVVLRHDEPQYTWHAPADGLALRLLPVPQPPAPAGCEVPLVSTAVLAAVAAATVRARRRASRPTPARVLVTWASSAVLAAVCWPLLRVGVPLPFANGVALPSAAQAAAVFAPLHANVYRAFACTEPAAVYDALAGSVEGSLLDTLYEDVYRSLVMHDQGGAVSRIEAVRPLVTEVERIGVLDDGRTPSFTVQASWQVDGAVSHWGHEHRRTSALRARYTVVETPTGWRIAGAEPLAQERLAPRPAGSEAGR